MAQKSSIEWTDRTWNPVRGCSMAKGSETGGCKNCYAARMAARNLPELKSPTTGESFARIMESGPRWTGKVELIESALLAPLRWKKPCRVFVNSMSDLFHESLSDEQIDRVFAVMALCPHITFQVLTKRAARMREWFHGNLERRRDSVADQTFAIQSDWCFPAWPLPNLWLGVSVEDQTTADARIPELLRTPAAKRFVSYEPALGPVDFYESFGHWYNSTTGCVEQLDQTRPDWLIIGGESGPGARPFDLAWARNPIRQCKAAGVACFVKQLGAHPGYVRLSDVSLEWRTMPLKDRKGGDMAEWPKDLRVRQMPS